MLAATLLVFGVIAVVSSFVFAFGVGGVASPAVVGANSDFRLLRAWGIHSNCILDFGLLRLHASAWGGVFAAIVGWFAFAFRLSRHRRSRSFSTFGDVKPGAGL